MNSDSYVEQVLRWLPSELGGRDEIAMEIRSTIAERLESGESPDQVLDQLGPPLELAESYMQGHAMERVSFGRRLVAKLIDLSLPFVLALLLIIVVAILFPSGHAAPLPPWCVDQCGGPPALAVIAMLLFVAAVVLLYPALCEWRFERTIGKHVMRIRVARESGARISFGQALLRHLPMVMGVGLFDYIFALFTKQHQRATELLSHTRTILKGDA